MCRLPEPHAELGPVTPSISGLTELHACTSEMHEAITPEGEGRLYVKNNGDDC